MVRWLKKKKKLLFFTSIKTFVNASLNVMPSDVWHTLERKHPIQETIALLKKKKTRINKFYFIILFFFLTKAYFHILKVIKQKILW